MKHRYLTIERMNPGPGGLHRVTFTATGEWLGYVSGSSRNWGTILASEADDSPEVFRTKILAAEDLYAQATIEALSDLNDAVYKLRRLDFGTKVTHGRTKAHLFPRTPGIDG